MIDVLMPQLGESVAEGTVTKWLVREGDFVDREQPLVEVATDKADTVIPSPASGRVAALAAAEGSVVPTQRLLCRIDETATQAGASPPPAGQAPASREGNGEPQAQAGAERPLTTPAVRRLALESGVDLQRVKPSGERGRVTRDDVVRASGPAQGERAAPHDEQPRAGAADGGQRRTELARFATPQAAELSGLMQATGGYVPPIPGVGYGAYKVPPYNPRPGDETVPFNRRRRITADHMVYSKATSPHVVTVAEVDLQATARLRDAHKAQLKKEGIGLTFLAFVCMATVKAIREYPHVNARVLDNSYVVLRDVNLGVAVDAPGGLIVPSLKHADELSLRGMARGIDEMATRARTGKITADDLAGTTFSVSNPGLKGNLFGGAIISQPNVAILRMGEIKKRVVVVSGEDGDAMAIHPVMFMALSYDHRIIDGVLANSFLWRVADILNRGEFEI